MTMEHEGAILALSSAQMSKPQLCDSEVAQGLAWLGTGFAVCLTQTRPC